MGRKVRVMPFCRPPRIREQPQSIAPLAQCLEDAHGLWVDGRPTGDRFRVAVHRAEQLRAADRHTEAIEGLAHESGRRAAPVLGVDSMPVLAFGLAHRVHVRVTRGPVPVGELRDQVVVGRRPLLGGGAVPVRPMHQRAAEVKDHSMRDRHSLNDTKAGRT